MALDLSSLQKAIHSLERAIRVADSKSGDTTDPDYREVIRAGVIQNFEFTYELCWKFIKRWLENNGAGSIVDGLTMKELFRMAAERQLISDVESWFDYHKKRNKTSHIYDEDIADEVYNTSLKFFHDAEYLLNVLESKND